MTRKIALLFSGRISDHKEQYDNIMNRLLNIQNNDFVIDIFISHPKDVEDDLLQKVIELYKPIIIIRNLENYDAVRIENFSNTPNINKHNIMSIWLSRYNLFNAFHEYIQANDKKYEMVISLRMDIVMRSNFDINTLQSLIDNNILCIPNTEYDFDGISDQFAFGNITTMSVYMKMFEKIYEILEIIQSIKPEYMLLTYLQQYNTFQIERCYIDYIWGLYHFQLLLEGKYP